MAGKSKTSGGFANHEIVTLAVYLLGGETKAIDTEHVAVKAAELAPGKYNWRHYPVQINIEIIRAFLSDAKKTKYGKYLSGSGNEGWMLTEDGAIFAKQNAQRLQDVDLTSVRKSEAEKKWHKRERSRLLSSNALKKLVDGERSSITSSELSSFFRVDEYVTGAARERKVTRIINAFRDDPDLGDAILSLREMLMKLEGKND